MNCMACPQEVDSWARTERRGRRAPGGRPPPCRSVPHQLTKRPTSCWRGPRQTQNELEIVKAFGKNRAWPYWLLPYLPMALWPVLLTIHRARNSAPLAFTFGCIAWLSRITEYWFRRSAFLVSFTCSGLRFALLASHVAVSVSV